MWCQVFEKYKILYQAYADEIKNLWQRSVFLATFMVLLWTGYGALQLAYIKNEISSHLEAYNIASVGLCFAIIVFSILWIAMAKGSKFVQEAHEAHINDCEKVDDLYCDLGKYENGEYDTKDNQAENEISLYCPLKSYRFSPSKINIALGWVSLIFAWILLAFHAVDVSEILNFINDYKQCLIAVPCIMLFATYCLKGGKRQKWVLKYIFLALMLCVLCVVLALLLPNKKLALNENRHCEQNISIYNNLIEQNKTISNIVAQQNTTTELIKSMKANLNYIQVSVKNKIQECNKCPNVKFDCYPSQR